MNRRTERIIFAHIGLAFILLSSGALVAQIAIAPPTNAPVRADIKRDYTDLTRTLMLYLNPSEDTMNQTFDNASQNRVDLSGIWESTIGWKYQLKQKGNRFVWTVINRNQTATGNISDNGTEIQVEWTENNSKGTVKGSIIEVDEKGRAVFIEWDNGVFFHRAV